MARVFANRGALAVTVLGRAQHAHRRGGFARSLERFLGLGHQQSDHALAFFERHAAHAARGAAEFAHVLFLEAHRLAAVAEQHHVVFAVGECGADEEVAVVEIDGDDAGLARVAELVQRSFLDHALRSCHEDAVVCGEAAEAIGQRQHHIDLLAGQQREHVDDRSSARIARALGHFPHFQPVDTAAVREAQHVVVRVRDEQLFDPVVVFRLRRLLAASTALLGPVFRQRLALHVAGVAERDHHVGWRDQVLGAQVLRVVFDLAATCAYLGLAEFEPNGGEFIGNDGGHARRRRQDAKQVGNVRHHFLVLTDDLVLLQTGQPLQAHLQDFARLIVAQAVQPVDLQTEIGRQAFGPVGLASARRGALGTRQHLAHHRGVPAFTHQRGLGHRRRWRSLDGLDELVDVGQCDRQAFQHMATLARLAQLIHRAPRDHFAAVVEEDGDQVLQIAQPRLTVDQRHHIDAEGVLQLSLFVQVVQHNLGHFAALELDHHPHARLVGFVLDVADAFQLFLMHQLRHALEQVLLVHLIRDLIDDDRLPLTPVDVFEVALGAHHKLAASGAVSVANAGQAVDDPRCREIRRWDDFHQFVDRRSRVFQQMLAGVDHLVQVVRRDVGGHADRDAARTVDQQIWKPRWQHQWLPLAAVVIGTEVNSFLVQIGEHFVRDLGEANFGVTHGCRVIAIDRTEVALAIDQHVSQREILRHANDRVVHRLVTVRVILANHIADDAG